LDSVCLAWSDRENDLLNLLRDLTWGSIECSSHVNWLLTKLFVRFRSPEYRNLYVIGDIFIL